MWIMRNMRKQNNTYWVEIHVAGELSIIEQVCREYCMKGLCVTVTPERFIYTGGQEDGAVIGLINYPRFPTTQEAVWDSAIELALAIRDRSCQWSVLVMDHNYTVWLTNREDRENG